MNMKLLLIIQIIASFVIPIPSFAAIHFITHTIQQPFGGSQSPDDARTAGIAKAKREALEQFGTYIESTIVVKNSQLDSDEILALTAGVTKAEVLKQKNYTDGDAFGIEITVKVELDPAVLENSLKKLLEDRNHLKDLVAAREREKKLLARIAELEKENQQKGKTAQQAEELKKEFHAASQGLTAVEWFDKAVAMWDGEKYIDPEKVIEYLTQAIRLDPNDGDAYNNRGIAYNDLKQFDRAIADLDKVIRLDQNLTAAYYNRGVAYYGLRQFERAIADLDKAIRLDPNYSWAYSIRGCAYTDLKQFDRGFADHDLAIRIDPNGAVVYMNRGLAYAEIKQYVRAIADYDQAIRLEPNYSLAYYNRGCTYAEIKKFDRAIADYNQVIHLDPNNTNAYYNRGNAYAEFKQLDRVIGDYDQAIRLNPNHAMAYNNRGTAYIMLNKAQKGCADLIKACKLGVCDGYEHERKQKFCR